MKIAQILSAFLMASVAVSASAAKPLRLKKDNIHQVVQAMTLEEKARMVVGCSSSAFTGYGNSMLYVPGSAASTAMNERLGIGPTVLADGPAGLRISPTREGTEQTYYCTAFPIGTALASSWSTELVEQVGAADAVVCCWLPGQEGGNAVVDVMTGRENPSGKLTMTLPISYFDTNTYDNFPYDYTGPVAMGKYAITPRPERKNVHYINYEEGIYVGYRYYHTQQKAVSYPFGYGLSYTTFAYSDARVSKTADGGFEATVTVTNNGAVAGKEAVQLN